MKTITIQDIRSWKPCYDPARHLPEGWHGTVLDILGHAKIPAEDKIWVVLREELIDVNLLRLFGVWCARQVEHLMSDVRSKNALDVAELYANVVATKDELADAYDAARGAVYDAAYDFNARAAAYDAAVSAAAAAAAAYDAAVSAAARAAARAAIGAAAYDVNARAAAYDAAREVAGTSQVKRLIEMLEEI